MRTDLFERQQEIELWISQLRSKASICLELKCKPATFDSYLRRIGLFYRGNKSSKGKQSSAKKSASDFLFNGSLISSYKLKLKLLENGIKSRQCEKCNRKNWLDELIPLELHHINGNHFDNRLENLQLLCPNCHALTDNYSRPKIKKTKDIIKVI